MVDKIEYKEQLLVKFASYLRENKERLFPYKDSERVQFFKNNYKIFEKELDSFVEKNKDHILEGLYESIDKEKILEFAVVVSK